MRCDSIDADPASVHGSVEDVEERNGVIVADGRQVERHHHRLWHRRVHRPRPVHALRITLHWIFLR